MNSENREAAWIEAVEGVRRTAQSFVGARFRLLFENVEAGLLDLASRAEDNEEQNRIFSTMNSLLRNRRTLQRRYLEMVDRGFVSFLERRGRHRDDGAALPPPEAWQLVDKETIESEIPARNLIARANGMYREALHGIRTRLAVVNGGRPVDEAVVPAGPEHLVQSWRLLIEEFPLTRRLRMVLFALFDRYVVRELEGFYEEYNRRLAGAGILPHLRYEIRKASGGGAEASKENDRRSGTERLQASTLERRELEETMRAIREALRRKLEAEGRVHDASSPDRGPEAVHGDGGRDVEGLVEQTDRLQQEASSAFTALDASYFERVRTDPELSGRLAAVLQREKLRLLELAAIQGVMATVDHEVIELVGQIFECMLEDETLPNTVKALLSRLHTPYIKIALSDASVFVQPEHPARRLMDLMVAAGRRWVSEDELERGIFPCLQEMVERILRDYRRDSGIFETLLEEFEPRLRELESRAAHIEQRTLEAAEGQQRLEAARRRARSHMAKLLEGRRLPAGSESFFTSLWVEKLTLILLRNAEGEESAPWKLANRVLKGVLWTLEPRTPQEAEEFREELEHINVLIEDGFRELARYGQRDFERHFQKVRQWQEEVLSNPECVLPADEALVADLVEGLELEPDPGDSLIPEEIRAQIDRLEYGALVDLLDAQGVWQRRRLAWFNPGTGRFLFVDVMGARAEEFRLEALARALLDGRARIVSHDGRLRSFVDQALLRLRDLFGRGERQDRREERSHAE